MPIKKTITDWVHEIWASRNDGGKCDEVRDIRGASAPSLPISPIL